MKSDAAPTMQAALRFALLEAMRHKDKEAVSVYRATLAAIDNAEAVPLREQDRAGAVESSPKGLGVSEVPRRALTEEDVRQIVEREAVDLRDAASSMTQHQPAVARRLRHQADLLDVVLGIRGLS